MVLYVIGLGLGDEKDITVRGLEAVKRSAGRVYLEYYTSVLGVDTRALESFYEIPPIILADRYFVESEGDCARMCAQAVDQDVAFLVVGDPLCATTHTDLIIRARKAGAKVEVIHNASVMGAAASCGLQLYQFGYTVSIPLFEGEWRPASFYERIERNRSAGMHTLCLLDIKVKEPDAAAMMRGKVAYLPPRFMTVNVAIEQLMEVEERISRGVLSWDSKAVGMARLGQASQKILYGTLRDLIRADFGPPLHCLALLAPEPHVHALETEMLEFYAVRPEELVYPDASNAITTSSNSENSSSTKLDSVGDTDSVAPSSNGNASFVAADSSHSVKSSWMDQESDKEEDGV